MSVSIHYMNFLPISLIIKAKNEKVSNKAVNFNLRKVDNVGCFFTLILDIFLCLSKLSIVLIEVSYKEKIINYHYILYHFIYNKIVRGNRYGIWFIIRLPKWPMYRSS